MAKTGRARVPGREQRVDDEVVVVPVLLLVVVVGRHHLAHIVGAQHAEREAAHVHRVALAQRSAAADPPRHHRERTLRLQHRHVERRVRDDARERDVVALVPVGLVVHDPQGVRDAPAADRDVFDGVFLVGHRWPLGDVVVRDEERLARLLAVAEGGAVGGHLAPRLPQRAVGRVGGALVHGGRADAVGVRPLLLVELPRLDGERGEVVGVLAGAVRAGRGRGRDGRRTAALRARPGGGRPRLSGEGERQGQCCEEGEAARQGLHRTSGVDL